MTQNNTNHTPAVPLDPYTDLADTVFQFATAVEDLLRDELAYPFSVGSDALRDHAANEQHRGTRTKDPLTGLSGSQIRAIGTQCDLHYGIAALLPASKVYFSLFPVARTCVVTAAKAWFILGGATREQRLQRYLNEELDALYRAPWDFSDPAVRTEIDARTADLAAVGATAGLRPERKQNANNWEAPYLVRSDQGNKVKPPSETAVVRDMFEAAGLGQQSGLPYTLLSAATHSRFPHAGVSESISTGRTVNGVRTIALHSSPRTTAKVTVLAAIATRTHLRALARYANVSQAHVQDRLRDTLAKWCAIGGISLPE